MEDAPTYRIKDWSRQFENHDSKRVNHPRWVPMPNKHDGKSYGRLMALPGGICIFGAWVLIVEVASKMPIRGVLADHDGTPLTAEDLHAKTRAPIDVFEEALKVLSDPKIGWLTTEISTDPQPVQDAAALGGQSKTQEDTTEKGITERQPKPRRAEVFPIPPDSMLEIADEDRIWCEQFAPNVPDLERATLKWFAKQQSNRGRGKDIEAWKASWRGYMMNYSDGEQSRKGHNVNGSFQKTSSGTSGEQSNGNSAGRYSTEDLQAIGIRPKRIVGA